MGAWVVTFGGVDPALVRADSRDHAIRAACALCGSEAIAAEADIRARRARGAADGRYPAVEVHDWHRQRRGRQRVRAAGGRGRAGLG